LAQASRFNYLSSVEQEVLVRMRFTLVALAVCHTVAVRQQLGKASVSKTIASIGEVMSKRSSPQESLSALKKTSAMVSALMEQSPIDDHTDDADRQLLSSVVDMIENSIYSSMDDSHNADVAELDDAIKAAEGCNTDIANRQSPDGDLGLLHASVQEKQQELNRLQGIVDEKTAVNNTKWQEFDSHMHGIVEAPACPDLPAANMPALDAFFDESDYSVWFSDEQSSYGVFRDAFTAADAALEDAVNAYNVQKAVRDVQYCDWKSELLAACASFDECFGSKSDFYTNTLVPRVTEDMNTRIAVKESGDTVIHQIQFLLGSAAEQQTPQVDTSRYQIEYPHLPAKGVCDLGPLDASEWVPVVSCQDDAGPGKP